MIPFRHFPRSMLPSAYAFTLAYIVLQLLTVGAFGNKDCSILLDLFQTPRLTNGTDCCLDAWVKCADDGSVITVKVTGGVLRQPLSMIVGLSSLQTLVLTYSNLTGAIPQSLAQLTSLTTLDLSHNALTGEIPDFSFMNILTLDLSWNHLEGLIPSFAVSVATCNLDGNKDLECSQTLDPLDLAQHCQLPDGKCTLFFSSLKSYLPQIILGVVACVVIAVLQYTSGARNYVLLVLLWHVIDLVNDVSFTVSLFRGGNIVLFALMLATLVGPMTANVMIFIWVLRTKEPEIRAPWYVNLIAVTFSSITMQSFTLYTSHLYGLRGMTNEVTSVKYLNPTMILRYSLITVLFEDVIQSALSVYVLRRNIRAASLFSLVTSACGVAFEVCELGAVVWRWVVMIRREELEMRERDGDSAAIGWPEMLKIVWSRRREAVELVEGPQRQATSRWRCA